MTHWLGDGSVHFTSYQQSCLYQDKDGKLHFPESGKTPTQCDENSRIIYGPPTPEDLCDARSNHSTSSDPSGKHKLWDRSFANTAKAICKATKSFVKSCFDNFRRTTQSKQSSSSTSRVSGFSLRGSISRYRLGYRLHRYITSRPVR